jgi:predicted RNA-binding Zn ribbon-like protein
MAEAEHTDFRQGVPFLGGALWIDLLNTTPVINGQKQDLIADTASLRHWANLADRGHVAFQSDADLAAVHQLRTDLRCAFDDLATAPQIPPFLVASVNALLAGVSYRRCLTNAGVATVPDVSGPKVAATIADDFADFLTGYEPERLKHCANPACVMVFYDRGKNNRRRWCSMQVCGNRDKVANYRARQGKSKDI